MVASVRNQDIIEILLVEDNPGDARLAKEAVLSISRSEDYIKESYNLNANCYITTPLDLNEFIRVFETIQNFWLKTEASNLIICDGSN